MNREIKGTPSTKRIQVLRDRYLSEPIMVDSEYMKFYTKRHRQTDGMHPIERRAECHAFALEHLTCVIGEGELLVGNKTRYVRGAIPYCNYACAYVLREFRRASISAAMTGKIDVRGEA